MTSLIRTAPIPRNSLDQIRKLEEIANAVALYEPPIQSVVTSIVVNALHYNMLVHLQKDATKRRPTPAILISSYDERVEGYLRHLDTTPERVGPEGTKFSIHREENEEEGIEVFSAMYREKKDEWYAATIFIGNGLALMAPYKRA
jgi:hypothetical protein